MGATGLRAAFGVTLSAAALLAGLLTVTGCSSSAGTGAQSTAGTPTAVTPTRGTSTSAGGGSDVAGTCPVTTVHTGPVPSSVPGFSDTSTMAGVTPWMGDGDFTAVLFYAEGADPVMRAGGRMAAGGRSTKILWWVAGAGDSPLVIRGREATSGATFTQREEGIGGGQYPTVPVVPGAGCWTLTETVRGDVVGTITVPVGPAVATADS